ncbi:MAG: hypothetical protein QGG36_19705 [Pirellulaceae bacterium]|jgi:hypothetical protein|nr:hypothetical protein [Pirellulaceae bacterium]
MDPLLLAKIRGPLLVSLLGALFVFADVVYVGVSSYIIRGGLPPTAFNIAVIVGGFGALVSQLAFFVSWGILGPERFLVRYTVSLFWIAASYVAVLISSAAVGNLRSQDLSQMLFCTLSIPALMTVAMAPLWIGKVVLGWRIYCPEDGPPHPERRQFTILGAMIAMTVMAVLMMLGQFGFSEVSEVQLERWGILAGYSCGAVAATLVLAAPTIMIALLPRHNLFTATVFLAVGLLGVLLLFGSFYLFGAPVEVYIMIVTLVVSGAMPITLCWLLARTCGFALNLAVSGLELEQSGANPFAADQLVVTEPAAPRPPSTQQVDEPAAGGLFRDLDETGDAAESTPETT